MPHQTPPNLMESVTSAYGLFDGHKAFKRAALLRSSLGDNPNLHRLYKTIHASLLEDIVRECRPEMARMEAILQDLTDDRSSQEEDFFLCHEDEQLPLSIVVMSRNDLHVERMEERTQAFIDCIYHLAKKYETRTELLIVEWNPPSDRPSMAEQFSFPDKHDYVVARILTAPAEIHQRYEAGKKMPVFQMIAKNAGIRRARGRFIAVTNIDVLFSDELFQAIASPNLKSGRHYRSNRWDVDRRILDLPTASEMLSQAEALSFQVNMSDGPIPIKGLAKHLALETRNPSTEDETASLENLHTEACGDFQMLHRRDWLTLRGYSEMDLFSFHIDSLFSITCYHAGFREIVLPIGCAHYHIDHTLGVKKSSDSYEINEKKVITHITYSCLQILDVYQTLKRAHLTFNDTNWGLAQDRLLETVFPTSHGKPIIYREAPEGLNLSSSHLSSRVAPHDITDLNEIADDLAARYVSTAFQRLADYIQSTAGERSIYIWGAGGRGKDVMSVLGAHQIAISGFIDSLIDKPESLTHEGRVAPVATVYDFRALDPTAVFIVVSSIFANDILPYFDADQWQEGINFIVGL